MKQRAEIAVKYFLFGNRGADVYNGTIVVGKYRIRAIVDDVPTPFSTMLQ